MKKYINETNLCALLQEFIEANYKKIRISDKLQAKIERHYGATQSILSHYKIKQKLDKPLIEYSRYVLSAGTENEKTMLARGIKRKLKIRNGKLEFDSFH